MAYVKDVKHVRCVSQVDKSSTSFSLTTERFLRVSSRYLLPAKQTRPALASSVPRGSYLGGEFVDPPAFRSSSTVDAKGQLREAVHLLEARS